MVSLPSLAITAPVTSLLHRCKKTTPSAEGLTLLNTHAQRDLGTPDEPALVSFIGFGLPQLPGSRPRVVPVIHDPLMRQAVIVARETPASIVLAAPGLGPLPPQISVINPEAKRGTDAKAVHAPKAPSLSIHVYQRSEDTPIADRHPLALEGAAVYTCYAQIALSLENGERPYPDKIAEVLSAVAPAPLTQPVAEMSQTGKPIEVTVEKLLRFRKELSVCPQGIVLIPDADSKTRIPIAGSGDNFYVSEILATDVSYKGLVFEMGTRITFKVIDRKLVPISGTLKTAGSILRIPFGPGAFELADLEPYPRDYSGVLGEDYTPTNMYFPFSVSFAKGTKMRRNGFHIYGTLAEPLTIPPDVIFAKGSEIHIVNGLSGYSITGLLSADSRIGGYVFDKSQPIEVGKSMNMPVIVNSGTLAAGNVFCSVELPAGSRFMQYRHGTFLRLSEDITFQGKTHQRGTVIQISEQSLSARPD